MSKLGKHWIIITGGLFFDILGLIPIFNIVTNWIFTGILFLYSGGKKFGKTLTRMAVGSLLDSLFFFLPPCTYAAYKYAKESEL